MKISVIIPTAGNDPLRNRNFTQCIESIKTQKFTDYEVIVVEQSLDGKFYKNTPTNTFSWIGINDPLNRGFNLSWCRNVGSKIAKGEILILMDADMCFESDYFEAVSNMHPKFAGGANLYHWFWVEEATSRFLPSRDFNYAYTYGPGEPKSPIFRFEPFTKGCGYGAVLVFDRKWYWEEFGGYQEDFHKYGYEDKAAVEVIKHALGISKDEDIPKIPYPLIHLSHYNKDVRNMSVNESLFYKVRELDKDELIRRAKEANLGDPSMPKSILY